MNNSTTLIPIESSVINSETIETVNARDLHDFLEVGKRFTTWLQDRIDQYGFVEGQDFLPILGKSSGGRPSTEYHLSLDMAKELSMVERNEKGKEARQYFINCERAAKYPLARHSLSDLTQAAGILADSLRLEGSSRITAMRAFSAANCPELLPMLPDYAIDAPSTSGAGSSEVTHSASHLLKQHGVGVSAAAFNKVCHAHGLLDRQSRTSGKGKEVDFWCVTHAGLEYGKNVTSPQSPRQTQPHWYDDRFAELLIMLGIQQQAA